MDLEKDWIANAYEGMSRRQFLAQMSAAGAAVAGFAIASKAMAGEIIQTSADGLNVTLGYPAWPMKRKSVQHPVAGAAPILSEQDTEFRLQNTMTKAIACAEGWST